MVMPDPFGLLKSTNPPTARPVDLFVATNALSLLIQLKEMHNNHIKSEDNRLDLQRLDSEEPGDRQI